ncbi:MAG: NADH-quinone oxidoreductase subunit J [Alphaproteobacteria bacterium MarineAlpha5_Bin8]|nr:MAG: NADH-quinone oxidoreductase subunit J [Alphaproteobacteria bacterium MarineAlpha5_Bin7]PPR46633.1 MAG: NADH-quinone oxidoreductase subunit J [Alphaproteobacteria bacterium MarineAlpha5_Bin8]PPR53691.1 MAG: NADH-quinone oxidoreductase subunit J [Alphaproteobacteria bacterium MarineAlpha5_Bin6]|tara:strand:+ start:826 stop:1443 length:618 start_codon:yes stop_codon:yes gene_type:complete
MFVYTISFYFFSIIAILSALMVISAKNPVHSVLFLILSFVNTSALFVLLGAEFLAMILIVVYVGAVAVLFLFVVMMLDINFIKLREGFLQYLPFGVLLGLVLLIELGMLFYTNNFSENNLVDFSNLPKFSDVENTKILGNVLYTDYFYLFQISGIILLIAMIGSIVLTLRERSGVKKQKIYNQVHLNSKNAIEKKKIELGKGIDV